MVVRVLREAFLHQSQHLRTESQDRDRRVALESTHIGQGVGLCSSDSGSRLRVGEVRVVVVVVKVKAFAAGGISGASVLGFRRRRDGKGAAHGERMVIR